LVAFGLVTLFLIYSLTFLKSDSDLKKMVPLNHPYMQNLFKYKDQLSLGNDIRIAVEYKKDVIFSEEYLAILKRISDEVFFLPGVDKSKLQSLWTPNVRWIETTADGFRGGEVIPNDYDGSVRSLEQVRQNVMRSGQLGRLIADDFRSTIIYAPLFDGTIDYGALTKLIQEKVIEPYENENVRIHVVGFAKKMGDLLAGAREMALFFLVALGVTALLFYAYFRCVRSTAVVIVGSLFAVIWQLAISHWVGIHLDPYSMLVPFLVFAIAVSHSIQVILMFRAESAPIDKKENAPVETPLHFEASDSQAASCSINTRCHTNALCNKKMAAVKTLMRLIKPATLAVFSAMFGFSTLYLIEIQVIRDLALAASIGVCVIVLTNILFIPVVLSYLGVSLAGRAAQEKSNGALPTSQARGSIFAWSNLIERMLSVRTRKISAVLVLILSLVGVFYAKEVKVGDLDQGAPELRPESRYNQDIAFMTAHYSVSADVLVVMVETPVQSCTQFEILDRIDYFHAVMERLPEVQSVVSLATVSKIATVGLNEGNYKWGALPRDPIFLNQTLTRIPSGLMDLECRLAPVLIFLTDHKAETLEKVVQEVKAFAKAHDSPAGKFLLASGNAGVEAATNESIVAAKTQMLLSVYLVVTVLVFLIFRSVSAVLCIVLPLVLTSILCEALMAVLGIGIKVATLPVIALGVGIGVDYGIYIYHRMIEALKEGETLDDAIRVSLEQTGRAVVLTGLTLAIGVGAWVFSSIKFQADMGVLLCFMFLWNMLGALWLLPILAKVFMGKQPLFIPKAIGITGKRQISEPH
jgi:uncharacterized protein